MPKKWDFEPGRAVWTTSKELKVWMQLVVGGVPLCWPVGMGSTIVGRGHSRWGAQAPSPLFCISCLRVPRPSSGTEWDAEMELVAHLYLAMAGLRLGKH